MSDRRTQHGQWAALKRRAPDLLKQIESTGSVKLVLVQLSAARLEAFAASRPDVQAALARREADMRRRFETGTKDERDMARIILQRDFGWRDPPARSVSEEFGEILAEFAAIDPAGYGRLYDILARRDSTAAERRRKHQQAAPGGAQ